MWLSIQRTCSESSRYRSQVIQRTLLRVDQDLPPPPHRNRMGDLQDRDPTGQRPPRKRPPGQRPPGQRASLDRNPLDRDPHVERDPPCGERTPCGQTNASENIAFLQLHLRAVIMPLKLDGQY